MVDIHAHILPGLDDGARTAEEAVELARISAADGVTAIAATPHVRSDYPTSAARMERAVAQLQATLAAEGVVIDLVPGGEIDLGILWQISPAELLRFTLGQGGKYLLLETPYRGWPFPLQTAVTALRGRGVTPILAHPERNASVQDRPELLSPLVEAGALVQVTAASVEGTLGRAAQLAARQLVERRLVHVIASDAHGPHIRGAGLAAAARALGDQALAHWLTVEGPAAILAGAPLPAAPAGF